MNLETIISSLGAIVPRLLIQMCHFSIQKHHVAGIRKIQQGIHAIAAFILGQLRKIKAQS